MAMVRTYVMVAIFLSVVYQTAEGATIQPEVSTSNFMPTTMDNNNTAANVTDDTSNTTTTAPTTTSIVTTTTTTMAPTTTPILYNCSDTCLPPPVTTSPPCIKPSTQPSTTAAKTTLRPCMPNQNCSCNETDAICMNNTIGCNDTQAEDCDNSTTISTEPATETTASILSSDSPSSSSENPTHASMTEVSLSTSAADTATTMSLPICPDVTEGPPLYSCDRLTGHCQYGCPYDLAGPYCNISCFDNRIYNCEKCSYDSSRNIPICKQCSRHFYQTSEGRCTECGTKCAYYNSTTSRCNHNDGSCNFGCTGGYYGLTCSTRCTILCKPHLCDQMNGCCTKGCYDNKKCGCKCNEPCSSHCKNGVCNHECTCTDGCKPGFHGPKCDRLCSENCVSLNGSVDTCNSTNGHCYNGCVNDTFWTETCEQDCSDGCANGTCVQETGECIEGCKEPSLHGLDCSKKCSSTCSDQHCVREDGTCLLGCVDGWHGDFCEHPCAPNCLNRTCDRANESCTLGCTDGYFDRLCNRNCSVNCMNNTCDFSTGFCRFGCIDCFIGVLCDEPCPDNVWMYVAIGCGAFVVIVVPLLILFGKWKRQQIVDRKSKMLINRSDSFELRPERPKIVDRLKSIIFVENPGARQQMYEMQNSASRIDCEHFLDTFLKEGTVRYINEYQKLPKGLTNRHEDSKDLINLMKNFYNGIYPYDDNRVIIIPQEVTRDPTESSSDYINASYINGYKSPKRYIAAQGPAHSTAHDFWRMLVQQEVELIVMMTVIPKDGFSQVEKYWPEQGAVEKYDTLTVKLEKELYFTDFVIRDIKITMNHKSYHVIQLQFLRWADAGHQPSAVELAEFLHKYRAMISIMTNRGPIVVHCTDGSERTGLFIALDIAVSELADTKEVDVCEVVTSLREQRVDMVGRQATYGFLYEVLAHYVTFGVDMIPRVELDRFVKKLNKIRKDGRSNIRKIYEDVKRCLSIHDQLIATLNAVQEKKDRPTSDIPDLRFMPELLDVQYINAIQLDSYVKEAALVSTQMPSPQTIGEFCELVLQKKCTTIVMLNPADITDSSISLYWETAQQYDHVVVSINEVQIHPSFVYRKLVLGRPVKENSKEQLEVNLIQYTCWREPSKLPTIESFLDLLIFTRSHMTRPSARKLLVHCLNGSDQTGLFCALYVMLEKADYEQFVDVVSTVYRIMARRPSAVGSLEQFRFCYDVLVTYFFNGGPNQYTAVNKTQKSTKDDDSGGSVGQVVGDPYSQVNKVRPENNTLANQGDPYMIMDGTQRQQGQLTDAPAACSTFKDGVKNENSDYMIFNKADVETNVNDVML